MAYADALTEHLEHLRLRGLSPRTIAERGLAMRRLAKHLDIDPELLPAVMPADLHQWQRDISGKLPRYQASYASHARAFYRWCLVNEHVAKDPTVRMIAVKVPRRLPHPIAEEALREAIDAAPARIKPWLVLAAYSGLRAMEIAGLCREHVREMASPPVLTIVGKGNKERVVPLSMTVLAELEAHGMPARGFIFPRADGREGQIAPHTISHVCNRYLHGRGVTLSLHSLRHRFGTEVYRLSEDLRVTQEVLGHDGPATTAGYAAFSPRKAALAIDELGEGRALSCA